MEQSLKDGTQLGDYTIVRLIARGGMGEVYEAYEVGLDRRVAIKIIAPADPTEHDGADLVRRFMLEARTLARVNHPNVVTIHAIHHNATSPFIAMEYVEGVSLRGLPKDALKKPEVAAALFEQMLEGLSCLHENRILHRDLKPQNVLVRIDGQIKILDFGIAKHADTNENTASGLIVGSPPYMAPELRKGISASPRSDFWSLGAIFFECLTNQRMIEVMVNHEIRFTKAITNLIPEGMRAIIGSMCAASPEDRYAHATEILDDLQRFRSTLPPLAASDWLALSATIDSQVKKDRPKTDNATVFPLNTLSLLKSKEQTASGEHPLSNQVPGTSAPLQFPMRASPPPAALSWQRAILVGLVTATLTGLAATFILGGKDRPKNNITPLNSVATSSPINNPTLTLIEPSDRQVLWIEPMQIPTLTWSPPLASGEYDVQIASDETFQRIQISEPALGNSFRPGRVLPEAKYFWRLHAKNAAVAAKVRASSFTLAYLNPIVPTNPENASTLDIDSKKGRRVDLIWNCKSAFLPYELQLARDGEFHSLVETQTVSACSWKSRNLNVGKYFWRLRSASVPINKRAWSVVFSFTLRPSLENHTKPQPELTRHLPELNAPELKLAKQTIVLALRSKPRDLASLHTNLEHAPILKWPPVKGANRYQVQVSSSRQFDVMLFEETTSTNQIAWKTALPGHVFWRVNALRANGDRSKFSRPIELNVLLPAPKLHSTYTINQTGGDTSNFVEWGATPLASKYVVQFSTQRDLASVDGQTVNGPRFNPLSGPGVYYMRVVASNEAGEAISPYSSLATVTVDGAKMETPSLLRPPNGAQAPLRTGGISVEFSWTAVNQAQSYVLEIAADSEFTQILEHRAVKTQKILLEQAEFKGRVYWRVRAHGDQSSSDWSKISVFDIK